VHHIHVDTGRDILPQNQLSIRIATATAETAATTAA